MALDAGEATKKEDILTLPCDVLVPAAIGGIITEHNAGALQCKFLVEAANGPTTPEGDRILRDRGVVVLPDIYTNGGKDLLMRLLFRHLHSDLLVMILMPTYQAVIRS